MDHEGFREMPPAPPPNPPAHLSSGCSGPPVSSCRGGSRRKSGGTSSATPAPGVAPAAACTLPTPWPGPCWQGGPENRRWVWMLRKKDKADYQTTIKVHPLEFCRVLSTPKLCSGLLAMGPRKKNKISAGRLRKGCSLREWRSWSVFCFCLVRVPPPHSDHREPVYGHGD